MLMPVAELVSDVMLAMEVLGGWLDVVLDAAALEAVVS
jgi:hypothetical protein